MPGFRHRIAGNRSPDATVYEQWSRGGGCFVYCDAASGELRGHHLHESLLPSEVPSAARAAGLPKRVTCHTFRHSCATHRLERDTICEPFRNGWATPMRARLDD